MRIFPMPLSGEKKKMGKIEGGEALLIDKFSRVLFSLYRNLSWEFPFCRHTYFLLLAFGLYTQMLHHNTMTKKHRSDLINYNIYIYVLYYSCELLHNLPIKIIYVFLYMNVQERKYFCISFQFELAATIGTCFGFLFHKIVSDFLNILT